MFGLLPAVRPPKVVWIPLLALIAMAAWILLSLGWTESAERTFAEFGRIIGYLGILVLIWIGVGRRSWRLVAAGLLTAGVLVCFLTMMSRLWPSLFPSDSVAENLKTTRINYPFGYWNAVGCWSAMTITLCLAYAGHARSAVVRALALAAVPMCSVGLYLALSRAGTSGAVIGAFAVILLAKNRWLTLIQSAVAALASIAVILALRQHQELVVGSGVEGVGPVLTAVIVAALICGIAAAVAHRFELGERLRMPQRTGRPLLVAALVLGLVIAAVAAAAYGGEAWNEFSGKTLSAAQSPSDVRLGQLSGNRHNVWKSGWEAFKDNPVHGIGPGTFEFWWTRNGTNSEFVRDVHSIYLESLAETGIVGFLLLMIFLGSLLFAASATWKNTVSDSARGIQGGLVAVFIVFLFQAGVDWMWESTAVTVFALTAVAVSISASASERRGANAASAGVGLMLAAVIAILILLPGMSTERQVEKSQAAFRGGDYSASITAANNALKAQSWSASAYGQRALAQQAAGNLDAAASDIAVAEAKEPFNWRWPLIGSKIAVDQGDPNRAVAQLRRARQLGRHLRIFGGSTAAP